VTLRDIIQSLEKDRIRITDHADEELHNDGLTYEEVFISVLNGEIIEKYVEDAPYPRCLIFGMNFKNEPIHSVWAYDKKSGTSVLITVYRPDPKKWADWKIRR
jgi:hypothetical protein